VNRVDELQLQRLKEWVLFFVFWLSDEIVCPRTATPTRRIRMVRNLFTRFIGLTRGISTLPIVKIKKGKEKLISYGNPSLKSFTFH
jgi:hypothetical protein